MRNTQKIFLLWVSASTLIIILVFSFFRITHKAKPLNLESIPQFPDLVWSTPKSHSIDTVLYPNTENEMLVAVDGNSIETETQTELATYVFYDEFIRSQGYAQIDTNGKPYMDRNWTVSYMKGSSYFEIQYYPTPYKTDSNTLLLFSGKIL